MSQAAHVRALGVGAVVLEQRRPQRRGGIGGEPVGTRQLAYGRGVGGRQPLGKDRVDDDELELPWPTTSGSRACSSSVSVTGISSGSATPT